MASLYSTSLKTDYLDPRLNVNNRIEFRLNKDTAYYSNLRLVNLGAHLSGAAAKQIQSTAGLYGLIKNISLFDGAVELDRLTEANRYLAFRNLTNTNHDNKSLTQQLSKAQVGYVLQSDGKITCGDNNETDFNIGQSGNTNEKNDAYLDLRKCLPFLENVAYLDTSLFRNLRIIIEIDPEIRNIIQENNLTLANKPPILAVDEIRDPSVVSNLRKAFKGVMFMALEHDVVVVPDQTAGRTTQTGGTIVDQEVNSIVNGFDNKVCGRMVLMKAFSSNAAIDVAGNKCAGFGRLISKAMVREKINFRINGQTILPNGGLDKPSKKAFMLHDTWGDFNMIHYGNQPAIGSNIPAAVHHFVGVPADSHLGIDANDSDRVGAMDYVGMDFGGRRIVQLQLDYTRGLVRDATGLDNTQEARGLDLHMFVEVQKTLVMDGKGSYLVKYV